VTVTGESDRSREERLREIFFEYCGFVSRSLRHHRLGEPMASDALVDVFRVVHARLDDFDRERSMKSWLVGIVTHVAGEMRARGGIGAGEPSHPSDLMSAFVAALPGEGCAVFLLVNLEHMSPAEVADALAVEVDEVYAQLKREEQLLKVMGKRRGLALDEHTRNDHIARYRERVSPDETAELRAMNRLAASLGMQPLAVRPRPQVAPPPRPPPPKWPIALAAALFLLTAGAIAIAVAWP
jgi:DNA-directed RNA polymerase specialized sigma24 family protein